MYERISSQSGKARALFWYAFQIIKLIPSYFKNYTYWSLTMIKNYLTENKRDRDKKDSRRFGFQYLLAVVERFSQMGDCCKYVGLANCLFFHVQVASEFCIPYSNRMGDFLVISQLCLDHLDLHYLFPIHKSGQGKPCGFAEV